MGFPYNLYPRKQKGGKPSLWRPIAANTVELGIFLFARMNKK